MAKKASDNKEPKQEKLVEAKAQPQLVKAKMRYLRQTARKVRRTVNLVRSMTAGEAVLALKFMSYAAAEPVRKLVESAVANAKNNYSIENAENLKLSQILVEDGPTLKRHRAASRGRGVAILKRSSSISLVLSELTPAQYAQHVRDNSPRNKKNQKVKA